jgi:hypothetical protein
MSFKYVILIFLALCVVGGIIYAIVKIATQSTGTAGGGTEVGFRNYQPLMYHLPEKLSPF